MTAALTAKGEWTMGLRARASNEPRVKMIAMRHPFDRGREESVLTWGSNYECLRPAWMGTLLAKAIEEVLALARNAGLGEEHSTVLALEKVCAFVHRHRRDFGLAPGENRSMGGVALPEGLFPLDLERLLRVVHAKLGEAQYIRERQHKAIAEAEGDQPSPSRHFSGKIPREWASEARERAARESTEGKRFPLVGNLDWVEVASALSRLESSMTTIDSWHLQLPDVTTDRRDVTLDGAYTPDERNRFIRTVFAMALAEYESLVVANCAPLGNLLPLYRSLPVVAVVQYRPGLDEGDGGWPLAYAFVPAPNAHECSVELHVDRNSDPFRMAGEDYPQFVETKEGRLPLPSYGLYGMSALFGGHRDLSFAWQSRFEGPRDLIIRRWAYGLLLDDLEVARREVDDKRRVHVAVGA